MVRVHLSIARGRIKCAARARAGHAVVQAENVAGHRLQRRSARAFARIIGFERWNHIRALRNWRIGLIQTVVNPGQEPRVVIRRAAQHNAIDMREMAFNLRKRRDTAVQNDFKSWKIALEPVRDLERSGGTLRFSFGLRPCNTALRACTIKVWQPACATVPIKSRTKAYSSISSSPIRCLTVTGIDPASRIARTHSATRKGCAISAAPNTPRCTRAEGQPQFRLISSQPAASPRLAQSASSSGLLPPNCNATGCSLSSNAR